MRYDDRAMTATSRATTATRTEHAAAASSEECITPPASSSKNVAAKKKIQDLTPLKHSTRDQQKASPRCLIQLLLSRPKSPLGER